MTMALGGTIVRSMKAKYNLYYQTESGTEMRLLRQVEGLRIDELERLIDQACATPDIDPLAKFKKAARRPGQPVRIVALGVGNPYMQPSDHLRVGEEFESLTDFAEAVGTSVANASSALSTARRRGDVTAVVRGVQFGYVMNLPRTDAGTALIPALGTVAARAVESLEGTRTGRAGHPATILHDSALPPEYRRVGMPTIPGGIEGRTLEKLREDDISESAEPPPEVTP